MKKILNLLFPIYFMVQNVLDEIEEEVCGVSNRNFHLSKDEIEYKKMTLNIKYNF